MVEKDTRLRLLNTSLTLKAECEDLHNKYDLHSKRINKFIQWVEDNWNEFPSPETANP